MLILTLFVKNGGGYLSLLWYHMNFRIFSLLGLDSQDYLR